MCKLANISLYNLQDNIIAYKIKKGPNYIYEPILPIKIAPIFDMILAHNIADGTVINIKKIDYLILDTGNLIIDLEHFI